MDLAGQQVLVIGLARTGAAVSRFLLARGSALVIADDQSEPELEPYLSRVFAAAGKETGRVRLFLGGTFARPCGRPALAVVSPGVPPSHPTVRACAREGIPVVSEVELAWRYLRGRVLGITGSNGKTTCTSLLGAILSRCYRRTLVSGNIGTPLIDRVEEDDESAWHVVELSSFQLEGVDLFRPDVALMLNLTPDHLDRYQSMEEYAAAKARIFRSQRPQDRAVLNADDSRVSAMAGATRAALRWFSRRGPVGQGAYLEKDRVMVRTAAGVEEVMPVGDIPLRGGHNVENVLACVAAAAAAAVHAPDIAAAVRAFRPVEHRLEFVASVEGVAFYNDSKATNVDAALKALDSFHEPLVVIMGGREKGADFSPLRRAAAGRVRQAVLLGEAAPAIGRVLAGAVPVTPAAGLPEAVCLAFELARPGDVVLLAPACASFDMFRDYEERGRVFKEAVLALAGGRGQGVR